MYICYLQLLSDVLILLPQTEKKSLSGRLEAARAYLKVKFKLHCDNDNNCRSHCIQYALSNPSDIKLSTNCTVAHTAVCLECLNITNTINDIQSALTQLMDTREKELALHDVNIAKSKIQEWKQHIVRGVQQGKARTSALSNLKSDETVWIRDFAQKVNPSKVFHICSAFI